MQRKLEISDEEIKQEAERLIHESKKNLEQRSVQPQDAGSDVSSGSDGQPRVLDVESGRELNPSSTDVSGSGDGSSSVGAGQDEAGGFATVEAGNSVVGAGSDEDRPAEGGDQEGGTV